MRSRASRLTLTGIVLLFLFVTARPQTSVFLYQGRLNDGGNPANGNYDMQFKLFDSLAGGNQIGATQTTGAVPVAAGVFNVALDFGANAFPGASRYLEVAVRPAGNPNPHTVLTPRTQILTAPYSIRSNSAALADTATNATTANNALNLGGVAASEYVTNTNLGNNAIRNQSTFQANSNFNISGNGFVGTRLGVGTTSPLHRIGLAAGPAWTTHGWGGLLDLENSSAIGWRGNAGGTRYGLGHTNDGFFMFRTISELGTTTAAPIYDLKIDNGGNIGIGNVAINTDISQARLNIFSPGVGYGLVQNLGSVTVGTYVDVTGGWYGTRSNHPLHFFTNNGPQQMTLLPSGNFGIGTTNPSAKLQVVDGGGVGISVSSQGNALIGTSSGAGFASVFGENTSGSGYGVYGKSTGGFGVYSDGNAGQRRDKGGFAKALLYVNGDTTILRCYNALTGVSVIAGTTNAGCGFTVNRWGGVQGGLYVVDFNFQVTDRFISATVTSGQNGQGDLPGASIYFTYQAIINDTIEVSTHVGSSTSDRPFVIIVF